MIYKPTLALLAIATATPFISLGQDSEDEEIFELSPFSVEGADDSGYRTTSTLAGTRIRTDLKNVGSAISIITDDFLRDTGAIDNASLLAYTTGTEVGGVSGNFDPSLRYGNGVKIRFAIGFYNDKESTRRQTLYTLLDKVQEKVESTAGLYFEPNHMIVPPGDRKRTKGKKKSDYTAHAHFSISFDFIDPVSPAKRVHEIRRMISELGIESDVTKIFYGKAQSTFAYSDPESSGVSIPYSRHHELGSTIARVVDNASRSIQLERPNTPISIIKTGDAISISFFANHFAASESERIQTYDTFLESVASQIKVQDGLSFIPGNVSLIKGDQDVQNGENRNKYVSQAAFQIKFSLTAETDAHNKIGAIRTLVHTISEESGITHLTSGPANLVFNNPNQYRSEIVHAIHNDLELIRAGLGDEFLITPNISNDRVKVSQHSDTEVELWIPYELQRTSLHDRELEQQQIKLKHEEALSQIASSNKCCEKASKEK